MKVKRIYFYFFFFLILLFISPNVLTVYSQQSDFQEVKKAFDVEELPLFDCGMPGGEDNSRCCRPETINKLRNTLSDDTKIVNLFNIISGFAGSIPGLGVIKKAGQLTEKYIRIVEEIKNIGEDSLPPACFFGGIPDPPPDSQGNITQDCRCLTPEEYLDKKATVVEDKLYDLCEKYSKNGEEANNCFECVNQGGYFSALGCIYFQPERFILVNVFGTGLKLAGLFAFLCIIYSAIQIQLSQGNPDKIKAARERVTACIVGLLVVIFSVLILKIVGVNILGLPFLE